MPPRRADMGWFGDPGSGSSVGRGRVSGIIEGPRQTVIIVDSRLIGGLSSQVRCYGWNADATRLLNL